MKPAKYWSAFYYYHVPVTVNHASIKITFLPGETAHTIYYILHNLPQPSWMTY